jgi:hypothetical protein
MASRDDSSGGDRLSKAELQHLIHQKTLAILRDIDALIEEHCSAAPPLEPEEQDSDAISQLYLRWERGGGVGEEEE